MQQKYEEFLIIFLYHVECNPVVGSSKIYIVLPVDLFDNSLANLIL